MKSYNHTSVCKFIKICSSMKVSLLYNYIKCYCYALDSNATCLFSFLAQVYKCACVLNSMWLNTPIKVQFEIKSL